MDIVSCCFAINDQYLSNCFYTLLLSLQNLFVAVVVMICEDRRVDRPADEGSVCVYVRALALWLGCIPVMFSMLLCLHTGYVNSIVLRTVHAQPTHFPNILGPYAPQGSTPLLSKLSVTSKVSAPTSYESVGSRVHFRSRYDVTLLEFSSPVDREYMR